MCALSIGELARRTATPVATIRYYESIGVLPPAHRGLGGQRQYGPSDTERLDFVRSRRALGFSLQEISRLMALTGPGASACIAAHDLAQSQLARVRQRIAELRRIECALKGQIARCASSCDEGSQDCGLVLPP